jgi:hypothetical protein
MNQRGPNSLFQYFLSLALIEGNFHRPVPFSARQPKLVASKKSMIGSFVNDYIVVASIYYNYKK